MASRGDRAPGARLFFPDVITLPALCDAARACRGCDLCDVGTQTVFGAGSRSADVMFVGEQPGHEEDLAGEPFVGPAGRLLDQGLERAGIDRRNVYVTNVVKHFKWEPRGKRRIHKKPNSEEIGACLPWLEKELELVAPTVLVLLGATAAQALLGRSFRVTQHRGEVLRSTKLAPIVIATVHPSSVLRAPDDEMRRIERERFFADLETVARVLNDEAARGQTTVPPVPPVSP